MKSAGPPAVEGTIRVIGSRSHAGEPFRGYVAELEGIHGNVEIVRAGSSLKFCRVAEGRADIYPRLGPTMEWDTAAGHAVANAAGRRVVRFGASEELRYNKRSLVNDWFVCR